MSDYTEVYITDGVTEKTKLLDGDLSGILSVSDITTLLNFQSEKPIWHYFIKFTQIEAVSNGMRFNKGGLSGKVAVNGEVIEVEPFDCSDDVGLMSSLKHRAVTQYLARGRS